MSHGAESDRRFVTDKALSAAALRDFETTKKRYQRIADLMMARRIGAGDDAINPRIPAGYTYLGQLIAHDVLFSDLRRRDFSDPEGQPRTHEALARLDLANIYGAVPWAMPMLYRPERGTEARWRFVTGGAVSLEACPFLKTTAGPIESRLARIVDVVDTDLPRSIALPSSVGRDTSWHGSAVIVDPRNDQNLLISQLTLLFMRAHNVVADRVARSIERAGGDLHAVFPTARRMLTHAYRRIVIDDYLARLLDGTTGQELAGAYAAADVSGFKLLTDHDPREGVVVPAAFSAAGFRTPHVMAQRQYRLNHQRDGFDGPGGESAFLLEMLRLMLPGHEKLPITADWVVDWDRFFFAPGDLGPGGDVLADGRRVNHSHPLELSIADTMMSKGKVSFAAEDGGVGAPYLDLARALVQGVGGARAYTGLVAPGDRLSENDISDALAALGLGPADIGALAADPPLYLYILIEAERTGGAHLGPVGSRIVGEVITGAALAAERDAAALAAAPGAAAAPLAVSILAERSAADAAWDAHFAAPAPSTMPALLDLLEQDAALTA